MMELLPVISLMVKMELMMKTMMSMSSSEITYLMISSFRRVNLLHPSYQSLKTLLLVNLQLKRRKRILSEHCPQKPNGILEGMYRRNLISLKSAHKRPSINLWSNKKRKSCWLKMVEKMILATSTTLESQIHSDQNNQTPTQSHTHHHSLSTRWPSLHPPSPSSSQSHRLAIGSFIEDYSNRVNILDFNPHTLSIKPTPISFTHPYPPTKLMFQPNPPSSKQLLASSGDFLRLYTLQDTSCELLSVFNNSKSSEYCAPLTSFDWNELEPRRIGTSSIDTTCTIWDIEKGVVETQLIAHDKEVNDIAWGEAGVFASVSADGSVRVFDLRDKEHSTIIYESPQPDTPLLRLAWNKQDLRYMATILMDSNKIVILDIRSPTLPVAELERHRGSVNAIAWAPTSSQHICSAGDDAQALIWELPTVAGPNGIDPMSMYLAGAEINQLQWSAAMPDWIAIAFENKLQLLKV